MRGARARLAGPHPGPGDRPCSERGAGTAHHRDGDWELERISAARHVETDQEAERVLEQALARSVGLGRPDTAINACERRFVRAS